MEHQCTYAVLDVQGEMLGETEYSYLWTQTEYLPTFFNPVLNILHPAPKESIRFVPQ